MLKILLPLFFLLFQLQSFAQTNNTPKSIEDEGTAIELKRQKIAADPEAYRALGGDPNSVLENAGSKNTATSPQAHSLPEFDAKTSFQLIATELIVLDGKTISAAESAKESQDLEEIFKPQSFQLQYNENLVRLFYPSKLDFRALEKREANNIEWYFENKDCPSCSKTLYLKLEEETASNRTYLLLSEDEAAVVAYRLYFSIK